MMPLSYIYSSFAYISCASICFLSAPVNAEEYAFFHENVMGTSLELRIHSEDKETAKQAEEAALLEIDRLSELFSHYSSTSEFARVAKLSVGDSMEVSPELANLLSQCEHWQTLSHGAFNPGAELLCSRWRKGSSEGLLPSKEELATLVREVNQPHWSVDLSHNRVTRLSTVPLTLNAIAKGKVLDLVSQKLMLQFPQLTGVSINVGGDVRIAGNTTQAIDIANPHQDRVGASPLQRILLANGAIATSGTSERSIKIGSESYSHIVDPRSGIPCGQIQSASVIANDAETADVLATICSVAPANVSLSILSKIPGAKCLLVDMNGALIASPNWPLSAFQEEKKGEDAKKAESIPTDYNLTFEINKASEGGRYRRPYVAVWIEDKDGFPVKTLSLFLMTDNPGPRWHRDLRRWYTSDQVRLLVDQKKLIGSISKPTRNPGVYKIAWDGKDDNGVALPNGKYTLYVEAAREHGTYQLMKSPFAIGDGDFELKLEGNVEIKSASLVYKKSK